MVVAGLVAGVAAPVQAELGLSGILAGEGGVKNVGLAVKNAVAALYSSGAGDTEIQDGLVNILNEAVATGNKEAVRYTVVAVLLAGGQDNLALGKAAVDQSNTFEQFPQITALTVSSVTSLLSASGGEGDGTGPGGESVGEDKTADEGEAPGSSDEFVGGDETGGEGESGGGQQFGGGEQFGGDPSDEMFDDDPGMVDDGDSLVTPT